MRVCCMVAENTNQLEFLFLIYGKTKQRLKTLGPTVWTISMTTWDKVPCIHIAIFGQPLVVEDPVKAILKNVCTKISTSYLAETK